jgi:hypothetical protein
MAMLHNKSMNEATHLNMNGCAINFAALMRSLHTLEWHMSPAQLFSVQIQSMLRDKAVEITTKVDPEAAEELLKHETKHTLLGIPVIVRKDFPECWVRLYAGNKLLVHIDGLAIPSLYASYKEDWQTHVDQDNEKANKIFDADEKE